MIRSKRQYQRGLGKLRQLAKLARSERSKATKDANRLLDDLLEYEDKHDL